ncbi:MAG: methionine--tRNA ligase [Holosporales bacterium]|nr:methionine--tRNA ligase [Holosporales bacterium]
MRSIYITTPIYYVNAKPHMGHAYTTVACDVLARYYRAQHWDVKFTTGTDEHGKKIEQSAQAAGIDTQLFTDQISRLFRDLLPVLNITNDDFIRTTELRHKKAVEYFWERLRDRGYIYLGEYSGWYDIRNEAYFSEEELIDGKSPLGGEVQYMKEPCYFFRLSEFNRCLVEFYEEHPDFILPIQRRNEILSFVKQGLKDLAISRTTFKWGIKVPKDPKHVVYVWLDALVNYLTLNGYPENSKQDKDIYWQNSIHIVGKEIAKFHAVYWPAFLMAAGIHPPKQIVSHGWWLSEGEKMSKSVGNVQDPVKYCNLFGSDSLRFYLMRELPFGSDGNFSLEGFINRHNTFLVNSFGNLCHRTLSFIKNYSGGIVVKPSDREYIPDDAIFVDGITCGLTDAKNDMERFAFSKYLERLENLSALSNQYIDKQKPWDLRKAGLESRMNAVLFVLLEQIYKITKFFTPVIPISANKILRQMNISQSPAILVKERIPMKVEILDPEIVFERIDTSDLSRFDVYAND